MATLPDALDQFLPEVIGSGRAERGFEFGRGIGLSAPHLPEMWGKLVSAYKGQPANARNASILGGFVRESHQRDPEFTDKMLEDTLSDPDLLPMLPALQSDASLDDRGVSRLIRAALTGSIAAHAYRVFQFGTVRAVGADALVQMLTTVANLADGVPVAVEALYMWIFCAKQDGAKVPQGIIEVGRWLLRRVNSNDLTDMRDHAAGELARICLSGAEAVDEARAMCEQLCRALVQGGYHARDCSTFIAAIFDVQPEVALDCFLADASDRPGTDFFDMDFFRGRPLEKLAAETLCGWAEQNPADRYTRLGKHLSPFAFNSADQAASTSPLFFKVLARASDKAAFLGPPIAKVRPSSGFWVGSRVATLEGRKTIITEMASSPDPAVKSWADQCLPLFDEWIAREREFEIEREESFE